MKAGVGEMKISKKILLLALSVFVVFMAFSAPSVLHNNKFTANGAFYPVEDVTLQPGSDESRMNFCWYSLKGNLSCYVQVARKAEMAGDVFPGSAASYPGTVSSSSEGYNVNKATVTGLSTRTEYVYRVGDGTNYSSVFTFKTTDSDNYNILFVSDPQVVDSGNNAGDTASWENTISSALRKFSNTSFILSAGDQVDTPKSESQYDAFLELPQLLSTPLAPAAGNHDNNSLFLNHYNPPNKSATNGTTSAGGDYWFKYGHILYIVLNTNNTDSSAHDVFIGQAIAANPDTSWTILMFHQSLYSSASHSTQAPIIKLRESLTPIIDKYHIDLVLAGHDHCYTRTYQLLSGAAQAEHGDIQSRAINPTGTVYITAGSASGSKYYTLNKTPEAYSAVRLQLYTPTFSNILVSDNTLTITTYRVDTMEAIDTYTIVKKTAAGFFDVPDSAWYSPAIGFIAARNIAAGTGNNKFSPDATLTRGQFIVMLLKAYGIAPEASATDNFADAGSTYYTGYLAAAKHLGITKGVGNNNYLPESNITRQDMFTLLNETLKSLGKLPAGTNGTAITRYSDADQIADYAQEAIKNLAASSIITGSDGMISPAGLSTRAQMAQVLYKLLSEY
jgi:hypothetical protein